MTAARPQCGVKRVRVFQRNLDSRPDPEISGAGLITWRHAPSSDRIARPLLTCDPGPVTRRQTVGDRRRLLSARNASLPGGCSPNDIDRVREMRPVNRATITLLPNLHGWNRHKTIQILIGPLHIRLIAIWIY